MPRKLRRTVIAAIFAALGSCCVVGTTAAGAARGQGAVAEPTHVHWAATA